MGGRHSDPHLCEPVRRVRRRPAALAGLGVRVVLLRQAEVCQLGLLRRGAGRDSQHPASVCGSQPRAVACPPAGSEWALRWAGGGGEGSLSQRCGAARSAGCRERTLGRRRPARSSMPTLFHSRLCHTPEVEL